MINTILRVVAMSQMRMQTTLVLKLTLLIITNLIGIFTAGLCPTCRSDFDPDHKSNFHATAFSYHVLQCFWFILFYFVNIFPSNYFLHDNASEGHKKTANLLLSLVFWQICHHLPWLYKHFWHFEKYFSQPQSLQKEESLFLYHVLVEPLKWKSWPMMAVRQQTLTNHLQPSLQAILVKVLRPASQGASLPVWRRRTKICRLYPRLTVSAREDLGFDDASDS